MPAQQQDYILRHIQTISQLIARLRRKGKKLGEEDVAEVNEALLLALHLQEKNFGMPAAQFLALPAAEQIATLRQGETRAAGDERCLTYVSLLRDTAELYAFRGKSDHALGARQLALHVALAIALDHAADPAAVARLVQELLHLLDGADLPPPTWELLERFEASQ
ncbi:MAG TPA: hypothetical protein VG734_21260 [Lacunisphaera sp.]|nr:hypothetical protein [Lacunisphaera sp.]